jgi:hypothetical protein
VKNLIILLLLFPSLCFGGGVAFKGTAASKGFYYGVSWNQSADTYSRTGQNAGQPVGQKLAEGDIPIQSQMKRVILSDSGEEQYFLCPTDATKKEDCVTASDLSGADGQVMVRVPKFYYRYVKSGSVYTWDISLNPRAGFAVHPAFIKAGAEVNARYVGAYEGSMYDASAGGMVAAANVVANIYAAGDKMCSVSGVYPKTSETIAEYRAMATARGAGWHQFDAYLMAAIQLLYLVEYADFDSQAMVGNGRVSLTNGDWVASEIHDGVNYGYIGKCGMSNSVGNATGANSAATNLNTAESPAYMSYRGVENFWGNVWQFVDGANVHNSVADKSRLYLSGDYAAFASDTGTGYSMVGLLAEVDGYATDIVDAVGFWPRTATGGGSATYLADYYSTYFNDDPAVGWRVCLFGGTATYGSAAGAFSVYSDRGSSDAFASIGGRLCF